MAKRSPKKEKKPRTPKQEEAWEKAQVKGAKTILRKRGYQFEDD